MDQVDFELYKNLQLVHFVYKSLSNCDILVDRDITEKYLDLCDHNTRLEECILLTEVDVGRKFRFRSLMCSECNKLYCHPNGLMLKSNNKYYCITCKRDREGDIKSIRQFLSSR